MWTFIFCCTNFLDAFHASFIEKLAEEPGAAWVNLQTAEHFLFCKQFSKMYPSAFRVSGLPGTGG